MIRLSKRIVFYPDPGRLYWPLIGRSMDEWGVRTRTVELPLIGSLGYWPRREERCQCGLHEGYGAAVQGEESP